MASLYDPHELRTETQQALTELRKLEAAPDPGTADERERTLTRMSGLVSKVKTNQARRASIRQAREYDALSQSIRQDRAMRKAAEEHERKAAELRAQRAAALEALHLLEHQLPLPKGPRYVAERLTQAEGEALLSIARRLQDGKTLNRRQQARLDDLVDKAAGEPRMSGRLRADEQAKEQAAKAAEETRRAALKQRPAPPPGSLILPSFLSDWLLSTKPGSLDPLKLGVLCSVALGLENHRPTLAGAHIETDPDGEAVMVVDSSTLRTALPGWSQTVGEAISYLARNRLIEIEYEGTSARIKAGARLRTLYRTTEGGNTDGA
jgi:hypothetical protein